MFAVMYVIAVVLLYCIVSMAIFAFRHPWMTQTEVFMFANDAFHWRTVTVDEVRSYENIK